MRTTQLRLRFLSSLAASGALVGASLTACGGAIDTTGQSSGTSGTSGSSGGSSGSSGQSSSGYSSSGTSPTPLPPTSTPKPTVPPSSMCTSGKPQAACYTHAQLVAQLNSPQRGGDSVDAGAPDADTSALFDVNGCLPANLVEDGCCNPAVTGPTWTGGSCCYVHCTGACCGRPFVVDGQARVAAVRERDDWMAVTSLDAPAATPASGVHRRAIASSETALDSATRARIGTAWAHDASMEHASVASFARFTLELLALGAPADLVVASVNAGRDEIEHAVACFAIASRYAGTHLGPARLDVGGAAPAVDLPSVVGAAIVEGCIGETLSALLAEARLARAEDDEIRAALCRIAHQEARHAELAWRFVGWAITSGGEPVREAAARAFIRALACAPQTWDASLEGITPGTLRAHGLLDEATAREVGARAFSEVIGPCAAALTVRASAAA